MIIKFECVFQDVRLAEVPEASHLVLIDFRTRVRILTVPSVKLQVPQPTLHLLFFSQNISSVQFGREGRAASLGGCRDTNPGSNPGSPQCGYSGFPIKLNTLCWKIFLRKKISGELLPETDLKFSAHSKKKSTPQNNEQNYHVFRISIKFPSAHRELYSTT